MNTSKPKVNFLVLCAFFMLSVIACTKTNSLLISDVLSNSGCQ